MPKTKETIFNFNTINEVRQNMKPILQILLLLILSPSFAQPTGHQRLFLYITDKADTIHFEKCFENTASVNLKKLDYKGYQLNDISSNPPAFIIKELIHGAE